jgi:hypothetical protein
LSWVTISAWRELLATRDKLMPARRFRRWVEEFPALLARSDDL